MLIHSTPDIDSDWEEILIYVVLASFSVFICPRCERVPLPQKSNFRTKNLIAIRDFYLTNSSAPLEFDYSVVHEMCLRYFGHAAATDKSGRPQRACGIPPLCLSGSSSIGAAPD